MTLRNKKIKIQRRQLKKNHRYAHVHNTLVHILHMDIGYPVFCVVFFLFIQFSILFFGIDAMTVQRRFSSMRIQCK